MPHHLTMMESRRITSAPAGRWLVLALLTSAWLLVVFYLKQVVGPLNPDEIYFSHTLWLTLQGKRQFLDFYSQHFPAYFWFYDLVLPRRSPDDLSFVAVVRWSNLVVVAAYVGLLFAMARRSAPYLLPLLLALIVVSRMVEVRSDTLGLLAFNAAWVVLLKGERSRSIAFATALALIGGFFSARGLVMVLGFAAAIAWCAYVARDWKPLLVSAVLFGCVCVIVLAGYAIDRNYVDLMVRSTLLAPTELLSRLSLSQRVFAFDRLLQTLVALIAMVIGIAMLAKQQERRRAGVVVIACAAQLLLIFIDPSPFPYVYAWAVMPSLSGLALANRLLGKNCRPWMSAVGVAIGAALAAAFIGYPLVSGHDAPTGSNYRLLPDAALQGAQVQALTVPNLVELMLSGRAQQSLQNQLLVRGDLCRRLRGPVLSAWQTHPICAPDATYYWFSVKWPNIGTAGPLSRAQWFESMFRQTPPVLFIWDGGRGNSSVTLNGWMLGLLTGYEKWNGFALREASSVGTDSSDRAASLRNSGRK